MADFDFKKLGDLDVIDEVKDDDTVLVVRDGKVYRADGSNLGGGGYLVDVAADEFSTYEGTAYIDAPIPGLMDAVAKGATVTLKGDIGITLGGTGLGVPAYLPLTGCIDLGKFMSSYMGDTAYEDAGVVYGGMNVNGDFVPVCLTNGIDLNAEASVSTAALTDEETTVHPLIASLNKLKEKWEARKNVENTN